MDAASLDHDKKKKMMPGASVEVVTVDQHDRDPSIKHLDGVEYGPADGKVHDAVFGDVTEDGPNYRNVSWIGAIVLMCKSNIGLGVLGIPAVFQTMGVVPGIILICFVQTIITWADYVVGKFKLNHPEVYSLADAGRVCFGRVGEEVFAVIFCIYMVFVSASGLVSISVSLNAISIHATCTAVFMVCAAVLGAMCCSIRTLGQITWLGWVGLFSILTAVITLTVSVGVQDRPADAPADWQKEFYIIGHPDFAGAMSAVASIVFATSATSTYFGIVSEMRNPRQFNRSMLIAQGFTTAFYIAIGVTVYYFCGQFVSFPALGSAGPLMKRVTYGIAIPGLLVTYTIYSHLPAKYIFVRLLRGSPHLSSSTPTHWMYWLACTCGITLVAYIIGSAIPVFSNLVGFIGAFFCPWICMIPFAFMWLHDNYRYNANRTLAIKLQAAWAVFVILAGLFLMGAGTWSAILALTADSSRTSPWSCADNSNSV